MKPRHLFFLVALGGFAAVASGQNPDAPPAEPPKVPDGWKSVAAKDGSYRVLFPADAPRSGSREQTFRPGGLSGRAQVNYCTLKDGTELVAQGIALSGSALTGLTIGDVYKNLIDAEKAGGGEVSEPKPFKAGAVQGREYTVTAGESVRRVAVFVTRNGRVYQLSVAAKDKDTTVGATADKFLKSLGLTPKAVPSKDEGQLSPGR